MADRAHSRHGRPAQRHDRARGLYRAAPEPARAVVPIPRRAEGRRGAGALEALARVPADAGPSWFYIRGGELPAAVGALGGHPYRGWDAQRWGLGL